MVAAAKSRPNRDGGVLSADVPKKAKRYDERMVAVWLSVWMAGAQPENIDPVQLEFFEKRIRPILTEHCYSCHSAQATKLKGGLRLDSRADMLKGGDSGPAIFPGEPDKSRLMTAIMYGDIDLQMPPRGKLSDQIIADFANWVKAGAVWPARGETATANTTAFDLAARKRAHWCWSELQPQTIPPVRDARWSSPVDRYILAKLEANGMQPSPRADDATLLRRLSFDLTGLPPSREDLANHLSWEQAVDRLLASPRFGEHWARHWLDLVRYAETHGHEFDYPVPNAYQYRDYVIRALNADVPYDQFVREHIAGDLLPAPRRHPTAGFNESILGTGFWWLGEQVHSPVDLRLDEADRVDNQIDVFGKTFLGLTLACARCHDHKFDAIATRDYYSLASVLASCGYRQVRFETDIVERERAHELFRWRQRTTKEVQAQLAALLAQVEITEPVKISGIVNQIPACTKVVDYSDCPSEHWLTNGVGLMQLKSGDWFVEGKTITLATETGAYADPAWFDIGTHAECQTESGDLGKVDRAGKTIRTPAVNLTKNRLFFRVRGQGFIYAAVQSYTLFEGPLHHRLNQRFDAGANFRWLTLDTSPYADHRAHFEFTALSPEFAVSQVILADQMPNEPGEMEVPVQTVQDIIDRFSRGIVDSNQDSIVLAQVLRRVPADAVQKFTDPLAAEQARITTGPRRVHVAPSMWEGTAVTGRVAIRGNPKLAGEPAPRRLPEAMFGTAAVTVDGSGRLEIAESMLRHPLTARILVNRVWHHLFGRGLAPTVDNFGVLGEPPTHPELLDYLADRFKHDGWSIKKLIRTLALTQAYQQSSALRADKATTDPQNKLLHRATLKRLSGEAIRDALLQTSGRLDTTLFGPPVPTHVTPFMDGRGKPNHSGPADGAGRRSIYLEVRRNFLPPLFVAFDTPTPFTTIGRRTESNVPAQALLLLNDPFVREQAVLWADRVTAQTKSTDERIDLLYLDAFTRAPTEGERVACQKFVAANGWPNLAHALINFKEFIYLH